VSTHHVFLSMLLSAACFPFAMTLYQSNSSYFKRLPMRPVVCWSSSNMPRTSHVVVVLPDEPVTPMVVMRCDGLSKNTAAIRPRACDTATMALSGTECYSALRNGYSSVLD